MSRAVLFALPVAAATFVLLLLVFSYSGHSVLPSSSSSSSVASKPVSASGSSSTAAADGGGAAAAAASPTQRLLSINMRLLNLTRVLLNELGAMADTRLQPEAQAQQMEDCMVRAAELAESDDERAAIEKMRRSVAAVRAALTQCTEERDMALMELSEAQSALKREQQRRAGSTEGKSNRMDWSADDGSPNMVALMSIDTEDTMYNFFAPITALLWTRVIGIRPVYMVFTYRPIDPLMQLILDYSERAGAKLEYVREPLQAGYTRGCVVMTARYLVGAWPLPEDQYIMLSDVDMWPLSREFFHQQDPSKAVHLLYANPYGPPLTAPRYASCYVGMTVSLWREVMRVHEGDMMAQLRELLDRELTPQASESEQWAFDQNIFAKMLRQWPGYPDRVQFVERDIHRDRIDRSRWHFSGSLSGIVESHILRPGYTAQHWPELRRLAAAALQNDADMQFVDEFKAAYCRLSNC